MKSLFSIPPAVRRILPLWVAVLALAVPLQAQQKIGTIDLKKVFDGFYRTKQADALLKDSADDAEKVWKGMRDDYQKANEEYKKQLESANDQAVSAEEREKRRKTSDGKMLEIRNLEKDMTQFGNERRTVIEEQKRRMRDDILAKIREKINERAKAGAYSLVLDSSGFSANNQTDVIVFTNGQYDLTEEVLVELNKTAPVGALTSGAKEEKPVIAPPLKVEEKPLPLPLPSKTPPRGTKK